MFKCLASPDAVHCSSTSIRGLRLLFYIKKTKLLINKNFVLMNTYKTFTVRITLVAANENKANMKVGLILCLFLSDLVILAYHFDVKFSISWYICINFLYVMGWILIGYKVSIKINLVVLTVLIVLTSLAIATMGLAHSQLLVLKIMPISSLILIYIPNLFNRDASVLNYSYRHYLEAESSADALLPFYIMTSMFFKKTFHPYSYFFNLFYLHWSKQAERRGTLAPFSKGLKRHIY